MGSAMNPPRDSSFQDRGTRTEDAQRPAHSGALFFCIAADCFIFVNKPQKTFVCSLLARAGLGKVALLTW